MSGKLKKGKRCSSACPTQDHRTFGECMRSKNLQVSPHVNEGYSLKQKAWDKELNNYADARSQGLEPAGTRQHHIDAAFKEAEAGN